jgi:hypothetical protein
VSANKVRDGDRGDARRLFGEQSDKALYLRLMLSTDVGLFIAVEGRR